jgi:hypothetical protein
MGVTVSDIKKEKQSREGRGLERGFNTKESSSGSGLVSMGRETCFVPPPASKSEWGDPHVYNSFRLLPSLVQNCFVSPYQSRTSNTVQTMEEPDQVRVGAKYDILISHSSASGSHRPGRDG